VLLSASRFLNRLPNMRAGQLLNYLSFWKPLGGHDAQIQLAKPIAAPSIAIRPNIVFILTDDQDLHLNSLDFMPLTQKHLIDQGTFYKRHYCTVAVCCPSRVSLWTGKTGEIFLKVLDFCTDGRIAHNTNVTDVFPPHGKL
jgi:hypothetical protein